MKKQILTRLLFLGHFSWFLVTSASVIYGQQLTVEGDIDLKDHQVINLADPVNTGDAATKDYVDQMMLNLSLALDIPYQGEVFDIEGHGYQTVRIGDQEWMAENLRVSKYNDNTVIDLVSDATDWNALSTGAWCYYDNDSNFDTIYGKLYNWYAVNTGRLCPTGWKVPSDDDWTALTDFLGGVSVAGGKMKETGTEHWTDPNTGATNESGFTGLPGGARNFGGPFTDLGAIGIWWSSTEASPGNAWFRYLQNTFIFVSVHEYDKGLGYSVRCIRD